MDNEYRVTQRPNTKETFYRIVEVYYNEDGTISRISEPVAPIGVNTVEDLRVDLNDMMEALNKPILTEGKIIDNE